MTAGDAPGVHHVDGPLGQIRQMAEWVEQHSCDAFGGAETLGKIARNLRAAADAISDREPNPRYYAHYQDDGPSGAGGQALSSTAPWDRLYVFSRPKPMLDFIHDVSVETFRQNARVLCCWAEGDEHYEPITDWTVSPWNG